MVWDKSERRKQVRREADRAVCPYHELKFNQVCGNITNNNQDIREIKEKMVTKEDLKSMDDKIDKKAPRWVIVTILVTTIPVFVALMSWVGARLDTITTVKRNQEILLDAFNINVTPKNQKEGR